MKRLLISPCIAEASSSGHGNREQRIKKKTNPESTAHMTFFVTTLLPNTILSNPEFRIIKTIGFNGQKLNADSAPELRGQELFIALAL